jgi:cysteine desulfurase
MLPQVKERIVSLMDLPHNPSSIHTFGRNAKNIVEEARDNILHAFNLDRFDGYTLTFTSSGTEANNLLLNNFKNNNILVSAIEHPSILASKHHFEKLIEIKVGKNGIIDLNDLEDKLKASSGQTTLVSAMFANNETGIIQPLKEVIELAKQYGAYTHSDMVQAIGKVNLNLKDLDLDFITISSHKIGGPLGAGALIRKEKIDLKAFILGGGQEKGLRSGTENVYAIAGFSEACKYLELMANSMEQIIVLREGLESAITEFCKEAVIIGKSAPRLPNTSLIIMPNVKSPIQLMNFDLANIAVSSGSACSSGKVGGSHVLKAMSIPDKLAECAVRVSLSFDQQISDIDYFVEHWKNIYLRLAANIEQVAV